MPRSHPQRSTTRRKSRGSHAAKTPPSMFKHQIRSAAPSDNIKYPKSELTIALDGELTPNDLAEAISAFARLLGALLVEEAPAVPLEWVIRELRSGSSVTAECRMIGRADANDAKWVLRVIAGGERFAAQMEQGVSDIKRSAALCEVADSVQQLIKGRVIRVRLEAPDRDYILAGAPATGTDRIESQSLSFGSVHGRVQALSSHGSPRFTLYDIKDDKGVSCYLPERVDSEREMLGFWGTMVEVEGLIRRDADTDQPLTIRDITISAYKPASVKAGSSLIRVEDGAQSNDRAPIDEIDRRSECAVVAVAVGA